MEDNREREYHEVMRVHEAHAVDNCPGCGWQLPTSFEVVEFLDDTRYGKYYVKVCVMCKREVLIC